ncbi:MAG: bifunctional hydroxymethylpyrimidine kinase/phosphomethylpyrimidine kinase, partial [Megasphaera micronuciformis]|nr:bifunctional hydroxymethylpyrimidine kinase/phosphomethylpyrimidine kinase [Megasphaera micronuciformis]
MMKHVLSIAGTDPSGGAGAAADSKTFGAHGCYAMNVITAVVSQNTCGVRDYMDVTPELIASQIDAVFEDISVDAVKIGMVSVPETIRIIASKLDQYKPPVTVIDPVMVATSGHRLLAPEAEETLKTVLLPKASIVTPNIPEAEVLAGMKIESFTDMEESARRITALGPQAVLVKG